MKRLVAAFAVLLGLAGSAKAATKITPSFYGTYVIVTGLNTSTTTLATELGYAKAAGIGNVRIQMDQRDVIEPSSGTFNWTQLDRIIAVTTGTGSGQYGMNIMLTIPTQGGNTSTLGWLPLADDTCPKIFTEFFSVNTGCTQFRTTEINTHNRLMAQIVTRYGTCNGACSAEGWNEEDFGLHWRAQLIPRPTDYITNFMTPLYNGGHGVDPTFKIGMGGLAMPSGSVLTGAATNYTQTSYFREALANGLGSVSDFYNAHIYKDAGEDFSKAIITMSTNASAAGAPANNIRVTETSKFGGSYTTADIDAEEHGKAVWLFSSYALAQGRLGPDATNYLKIESVWWHTLAAYTGGGDFSLMSSTYGARPAYVAHVAYAAAQSSCTYSRAVDGVTLTGEEFNQPFSNLKQWILWAQSGSALATDSLIRFRPHRVSVTELDGTITYPSGRDFNGLTITTDPRIIRQVNDGVGGGVL